MNNKGRILYCAIGFMMMILLLQYALLISKQPGTTESFTPGVREMYRPYVRQTRILSEGFLGDQGNGVLTLLKKFNLY